VAAIGRAVAHMFPRRWNRGSTASGKVAGRVFAAAARQAPEVWMDAVAAGTA
jgi:hypothetical protein